MTLPPPIAEGRTAEIFEWGFGKVLKLFREGFDAETVNGEASRTRRVHESGFPAPAVREVVDVGDRHGIVLDWVQGPSMFEVAIRRPWKARALARELAELHVRMHGIQVAGLPSQRARLESRIRRAAVKRPELRDALLADLGRLPEGRALCHGDFHPLNIILSDQGPVVIDWMDATMGNPAGDLARTSLLLEIGRLPPGARGRRLLELVRSPFIQAYARRYSELRPTVKETATAWRRPVAAARIDEGIPGERELLLAIATGPP